MVKLHAVYDLTLRWNINIIDTNFTFLIILITTWLILHLLVHTDKAKTNHKPFDAIVVQTPCLKFAIAAVD